MQESSAYLTVPQRWVAPKTEWRSLTEYILFLKQQKAYSYAMSYSAGKTVLDYGCGAGYGTALIAEVASHFTGVDMSTDAIRYCQATYSLPNADFKTITPDYQLPFSDKSFDVVLSFQVIEHIPDVAQYLAVIKRVLKDDGVLLIATPNRKYRLLPFQKPWNPEHVREYSAATLRRDLLTTFGKVEMLGMFADPAVTAIEHGRVKQSPATVYVRGPLSRLVRRALPGPLHAGLQGLRRAWSQPAVARSSSPLDPALLQPYSLDNFAVRPVADSCLDLLGVCRK